MWRHKDAGHKARKEGFNFTAKRSKLLKISQRTKQIERDEFIEEKNHRVVTKSERSGRIESVEFDEQRQTFS